MIKSNKTLKICVITMARSEYGLMRWLMQDLKDRPEFELQILVSGPHMMKRYGQTFREIEKDGFDINYKIPLPYEDVSPIGWAKIVSFLTEKIACIFEKIKPDLALFMGDRNELLAILNAGLLTNIPMGHISGGEITEGSTDNQIRHSATKMAHMHFVANKKYAKRVNQMGEENWRICISGEPGLDNFRRLPLITTKALSESVGLDLSKATALVTYHPVTQELDKLKDQMLNLTSAMTEIDLQYLITFPAPDQGSDHIIKIWENFIKNHTKSVIIKNLGQKRYISSLRDCKLMIGNSSSGIVEAAVPNIPVVNIGTRQKGRIRSTNVFDTSYEKDKIIKAVKKALAYDYSTPCKSLYGDGKSSSRIISFILDVYQKKSREIILKKNFSDQKYDRKK